jgi:hypothetical protein
MGISEKTARVISKIGFYTWAGGPRSLTHQQMVIVIGPTNIFWLGDVSGMVPNHCILDECAPSHFWEDYDSTVVAISRTMRIVVSHTDATMCSVLAESPSRKSFYDHNCSGDHILSLIVRLFIDQKPLTATDMRMLKSHDSRPILPADNWLGRTRPHCFDSVGHNLRLTSDPLTVHDL